MVLMYNAIKKMVILIFIITTTLLLLGNYIINEIAWEKTVDDFIELKSNQIDYFVQRQQDDLQNVIETNAVWTDLQEHVLEMDNEWVEANATQYLIDASNLEIDFSVIYSEDGVYNKTYGLPIGDEIISSESFARTLTDDSTSTVYYWYGDQLVIIRLSPILNDERMEPAGVYGVGRVMDDEAINNLKIILGESITTDVNITSLPDHLAPETHGYNIIHFTQPATSWNDTVYVNTAYDSPIYGYLFNTKTWQMILVILCVIILVALVELYVFKKMSSVITKMITAINHISIGNYKDKVIMKKSWYMPELIQLSEAVNSMSTEIEEKIEKIDKRYIQMAELVASALEINDTYTHNHSNNVSDYAVMIGKKIGYEDIRSVEIAGKLHDIGKISTPRDILHKAGKLSKEEFEVIKSHPQKGYEIIMNTDFDQNIKDGIRFHHEALNGKGYPLGLKGNEIPMIAQIIAVADVYDALTSDRPYREAMSHEDARIILEKSKGISLNPDLVDCLVKGIEGGKST
jgi:putative nucleotidyltransferase with HDIG domain